MPPLRLTSLLQTALPHLSESGRALLSALGCLNGHPPCPKELAEWLGFHDRYQLARALRREGLPPLEVIGGWARTLYWVLEAETLGLSLRELAEREHIDPAVAYRLVRRVTAKRASRSKRWRAAGSWRHRQVVSAACDERPEWPSSMPSAPPLMLRCRRSARQTSSS